MFVRFEKKVKHTHIATHSFTSFIIFPFERERERDFVTIMRERKRDVIDEKLFLD